MYAGYVGLVVVKNTVIFYDGDYVNVTVIGNDVEFKAVLETATPSKTW